MMGLSKEEAVAYTGRSGGPSFARRPFNGRSSSEHAGASEASAQWRKLAAWATTILRALNHPTCPDGLSMHAEILAKKIKAESSWKISDKERQNELLMFTRQITTCRLHTSDSIAIIIKTANKVAEQLEEA